MKTVKSVVNRRLASVSVLVLVSLVIPVCAMAQNGVPNIVDPTQTQFQQQTHFLTFLGSYVPESPTTAAAYYKAIDPNGTKGSFPQWLKNAGFISDVSEWNPTGKQKFACALGTANGCDYPAGTHGYGIINTDAHVIVLNAADLGFVRNQFIRCVPSCGARNPTIYTYLENYPVAPFSQGGSKFGGGGSSFPSPDEAARAIKSAVTRPPGQLSVGCTNPSDNPNFCSIARIADVAFEWAAPENSSPTSSTRFGTLFAYLFHVNGATISETLTWPDDPAFLSGPNINGRTDHPPLFPVVAGDPFAPDLDGLGFKQHPGLCLICHGGAPKNLTSTGTYPRGGNINGFRLLPLDNTNLMFTSDGGSEATSRASQEAATKVYNLAVLRTVPTQAERDDQGVLRVPHLREVINGWYAGTPSDPSGLIQNQKFVPKGWGGDPTSTLGQFYLQTVAPACRSCHFNRELSLDFGTVQNFDQESDLLQLALLPECESNTPDPNKRPMPLAHLTFQRLWEGNGRSDTALFEAVVKLKAHFGFNTPNAYCATRP